MSDFDNLENIIDAEAESAAEVKPDFVHLHLHTEYSLLDGAVRLVYTVFKSDGAEEESTKICPLADALEARGMKACAITDHGNMFGVHAFVSGLRKKGIKPIIGSEFYVADDLNDKSSEVLHKNDHLVLLAKNLIGYKNLMKLSTISFKDGFYGKPRIDLNVLEKHTEGLICCSACLAGRIPRFLLHNDYKGAVQYALRLKEMFAEGDFYIELQDHDSAEDKKVLPQLVKLAAEIGVKTVATNDVHYIEREDADTQDTMECINLGCKKDEPNRARFDSDKFYLKTTEEMVELFKAYPEAIASTVEIADKVEDYFVVKRKEYLIPHFEHIDMKGRTAGEFLRDIVYEKMTKKYAAITDEISQRINHELSIIDQCGFNDYFLIVWDYVNAAKEMGIAVGPGRGSGVGSIVAYIIGITDVDPLRYNLLFERFLSAERVSMPDFDVDFCYVRRPEVIEYCIRKYGKDNVAQIIAYSTMSAKAAVKDVARVYGVDYNESNSWVKNIPIGKVQIKQVLTPGNKNYSEDFLKLYNSNPTAKQIIDVAIKLEGMPRQTSEHAAGVVISNKPIVEYVALSRSKENLTTQFDKKVVESIGLLKMDFLGLKTLTDITEALKYIKEDKGIDIDFNQLGYEDPKVYELISSGDCEAVFQLESGGMKKFMNRLQPTTIEDVIAGISMYRPGPIQFIDKFIDGKKHPESVVFLDSSLKEILDVTYGCIVYQEQIMQIAQKVAGYSFGCADLMRRAMSSKNPQLLEKQKSIFINGGCLEEDIKKQNIDGAVARGMNESVAEQLFDQIVRFAGYAFNKSHATAYTYITYQTAYLKCYYPVHYLVAVVNNRITNADEVRHYINYLRRQGVKIMPPDINRSRKHFSIEGDNVRYGLMGIKNVGEQAMEFVLNERENGEFRDIRDLISRCSGQINKRMVESLIKGGALDCFGKTRSTLMASYERIMAAVANDKKSSSIGQMSLFDALDEDVTIHYTELSEYPKQQVLSGEKEVLGMYVSGHPLDDYEPSSDFNFDTSMIYVEPEITAGGAGAAGETDEVYETDEAADIALVVDKSLANKNIRMGCIVSSFEIKISKKSQQKFAVGRLEDRMNSIAFGMFGRAFEQYAEYLSSDSPVKVYGRVDLRDESEPKITIDRIEPWKNTNPVKRASKEVVQIRIETLTQQKLVAGLLPLFPGDAPVQAQVKRDGVDQLLEFALRVNPSEEFISRLVGIVGSTNIILKRN